MRRLVILIATACGSGSDAPPKPEPAPAPPTPKPMAPITGAHGGIINAIAVTSDATAAVTGDPTGGLRLWPTLDGTREPIAIKAPVADALAIVKDGSGFAIAVTDAANQVEVVRVDGRGNARSRRKLGEAKQVEA